PRAGDTRAPGPRPAWRGPRPRPPSRGSGRGRGWSRSPPSRLLRPTPFGGSLAHQHGTVARARYCPPHEEEIVVGAHGDDLEVAGRHALIAVTTRHALALADASRGRAGADRATVSEVFVRPVRPGEAAEAVTLHDARRPAPLADAGDMHALARPEHVADADLAPDGGRLPVREAELAENREGAGPGL